MTSTPPAVAPGFDEQKLLAELQGWWDEQLGNGDPFAAPKPPSGTILDAVPLVDSLAVVEALVLIDKYLPFTVHPTVIRPGGYDSFEDMITDLLPKLQALMQEHSGKSKPKPISEKII